MIVLWFEQFGQCWMEYCICVEVICCVGLICDDMDGLWIVVVWFQVVGLDMSVVELSGVWLMD